MYFFDVDNLAVKWVYLLGMLIGFPFFLLLVLLGLVIVFAVAIPVGFVIGVYYGCSCCPTLISIFGVFLAISGALGAIIVPFVYTYTISGPFFIHLIRRYKMSIEAIYLRCMRNN